MKERERGEEWKVASEDAPQRQNILDSTKESKRKKVRWTFKTLVNIHTHTEENKMQRASGKKDLLPDLSLFIFSMGIQYLNLTITSTDIYLYIIIQFSMIFVQPEKVTTYPILRPNEEKPNGRQANARTKNWRANNERAKHRK